MPQIQDLSDGRPVDFAFATINVDDFRRFVQVSDENTLNACRCIVLNAVFGSILDLSDGRRSDGSPIWALEFRGCIFHKGFCADGARLERLSFSRCQFVAKENVQSVPFPQAEVGLKRSRLRKPLNCVSLRHCRIETELRIELLQPNDWNDQLGVLTVDALAIRIGTNLHINDTLLRAQRGESSDITDEAHYALHLATSSIGGDVQLWPHVVLEGGLKMRDAKVGGSIWATGLRATDGENEESRNQLIASGHAPRRAFWVDTTDVQGNLIILSTPGLPFVGRGTVSMMNTMIVGDLRVDGEINEVFTLQGATVKGMLTIEGEIKTIYAPQLMVDGDARIACSKLAKLDLSGAAINGKLDVSGSKFMKEPQSLEVRAIARSANLGCYKNAVYSEVIFWKDSISNILLACFLTLENGNVVVLDGTSTPLHTLNSLQPAVLSLETADHARQYLRLFCASVWGDGGSFAVIDRLEDLPVTIDKRTIDAHRLGVEMSRVDQQWSTSAYVRYNNLLFRVSFVVYMTGLVEMKDDAPDEADYTNSSDTKKFMIFFKPYRFISPGNFIKYSSDFLSSDQKFVPLSSSTYREGAKSFTEALRALGYKGEYLSEANLSGASCKIVSDWKLEEQQAKESFQRQGVQALQLVWPNDTNLQDFDYKQLPFSDDSWENVRDKRLSWVRRSEPAREPIRTAVGKFSFLCYIIAALIYAASVFAVSLPLTKMPAPTEDVSEHIAGRTFVFFALLSGFAILYARRKWKQADCTFSSQPFSHLAAVFRQSGNDEAARDVEAEKIWQEAVKRGKSSFGHWIALHLIWRPYGIFFNFGLSPLLAFFSVVLVWCLGWGCIFLLSNNGMLRTNIMRVAPQVLSERHRPVQMKGEIGQDLVEADYSCDEDIEPALYAFELMTPVLNLHQESRCEIRSKPKVSNGKIPPFTIPMIKMAHLPIMFSYGWFWEYIKSLYMLVGSVITSLALLTFSGIARRWEH